MSLAKKIEIKESISQLRVALKKSSALIVPRLRMLVSLKQAGENSISKRKLAYLLGVDPNSVQKWRSLYQKGGLSLLCTHQREGPKARLFTPQEHQALSEHLHNPENGLQGYKELQAWIATHFGKKIHYGSLWRYCKSHFGSKIKVARKSHLKKDLQVLEAFKKTLVPSVKASVSKKP